MVRHFSSSCYCTNIRRTANIMSEYYDRKLAPAGVNVAQFALIRNLDRLGSANQSEWAESAGIERTTMVRNARRLEELGLIRREEGRGKVYTLSPAGEDCLAAGSRLWESAQAEIESLLGADLSQAVLKIGERIQSL